MTKNSNAFQTVVLDLCDFNKNLLGLVSDFLIPILKDDDQDLVEFSNKRLEIMGENSINERLTEEQYNRTYHLTRIDLVSPLYLDLLQQAVNYPKKNIFGISKHSTCVDFVLDNVDGFDFYKNYMKKPKCDPLELVDWINLQADVARIMCRASEGYMLYQNGTISYGEAVGRIVMSLSSMTRKMKNMAIRNNQEKCFMENFILKFESFIEVAKDPD